MLVLNLINSTISLAGIFGTGALFGGIIMFLIMKAGRKKDLEKNIDIYSKGLLNKYALKIRELEKKNERLTDQRDKSDAKIIMAINVLESKSINEE